MLKKLLIVFLLIQLVKSFSFGRSGSIGIKAGVGTKGIFNSDESGLQYGSPKLSKGTSSTAFDRQGNLNSNTEVGVSQKADIQLGSLSGDRKIGNKYKSDSNTGTFGRGGIKFGSTGSYKSNFGTYYDLEHGSSSKGKVREDDSTQTRSDAIVETNKERVENVTENRESPSESTFLKYEPERDTSKGSSSILSNFGGISKIDKIDAQKYQFGSDYKSSFSTNGGLEFGSLGKNKKKSDEVQDESRKLQLGGFAKGGFAKGGAPFIDVNFENESKTGDNSRKNIFGNSAEKFGSERDRLSKMDTSNFKTQDRLPQHGSEYYTSKFGGRGSLTFGSHSTVDSHVFGGGDDHKADFNTYSKNRKFTNYANTKGMFDGENIGERNDKYGKSEIDESVSSSLKFGSGNYPYNTGTRVNFDDIHSEIKLDGKNIFGSGGGYKSSFGTLSGSLTNNDKTDSELEDVSTKLQLGVIGKFGGHVDEEQLGNIEESNESKSGVFKFGSGKGNVAVGIDTNSGGRKFNGERSSITSGTYGATEKQVENVSDTDDKFRETDISKSISTLKFEPEKDRVSTGAYPNFGRIFSGRVSETDDKFRKTETSKSISSTLKFEAGKDRISSGPYPNFGETYSGIKLGSNRGTQKFGSSGGYKPSFGIRSGSIFNTHSGSNEKIIDRTATIAANGNYNESEKSRSGASSSRFGSGIAHTSTGGHIYDDTTTDNTYDRFKTGIGHIGIINQGKLKLSTLESTVNSGSKIESGKNEFSNEFGKNYGTKTSTEYEEHKLKSQIGDSLNRRNLGFDKNPSQLKISSDSKTDITMQDEHRTFETSKENDDRSALKISHDFGGYVYDKPNTKFNSFDSAEYTVRTSDKKSTADNLKISLDTGIGTKSASSTSQTWRDGNDYNRPTVKLNTFGSGKVIQSGTQHRTENFGSDSWPNIKFESVNTKTKPEPASKTGNLKTASSIKSSASANYGAKQDIKWEIDSSGVGNTFLASVSGENSGLKKSKSDISDKKSETTVALSGKTRPNATRTPHIYKSIEYGKTSSFTPSFTHESQHQNLEMSTYTKNSDKTSDFGKLASLQTSSSKSNNNFVNQQSTSLKYNSGMKIGKPHNNDTEINTNVNEAIVTKTVIKTPEYGTSSGYNFETNSAANKEVTSTSHFHKASEFPKSHSTTTGATSFSLKSSDVLENSALTGKPSTLNVKEASLGFGKSTSASKAISFSSKLDDKSFTQQKGSLKYNSGSKFENIPKQNLEISTNAGGTSSTETVRDSPGYGKFAFISSGVGSKFSSKPGDNFVNWESSLLKYNRNRDTEKSKSYNSETSIKGDQTAVSRKQISDESSEVDKLATGFGTLYSSRSVDSSKSSTHKISTPRAIEKSAYSDKFTPVSSGIGSTFPSIKHMNGLKSETLHSVENTNVGDVASVFGTSTGFSTGAGVSKHISSSSRYNSEKWKNLESTTKTAKQTVSTKVANKSSGANKSSSLSTSFDSSFSTKTNKSGPQSFVKVSTSEINQNTSQFDKSTSAANGFGITKAISQSFNQQADSFKLHTDTKDHTESDNLKTVTNAGVVSTTRTVDTSYGFEKSKSGSSFSINPNRGYLKYESKSPNNRRKDLEPHNHPIENTVSKKGTGEISASSGFGIKIDNKFLTQNAGKQSAGSKSFFVGKGSERSNSEKFYTKIDTASDAIKNTVSSSSGAYDSQEISTKSSSATDDSSFKTMGIIDASVAKKGHLGTTSFGSQFGASPTTSNLKIHRNVDSNKDTIGDSTSRTTLKSVSNLKESTSSHITVDKTGYESEKSKTQKRIFSDSSSEKSSTVKISSQGSNKLNDALEPPSISLSSSYRGGGKYSDALIGTSKLDTNLLGSNIKSTGSSFASSSEFAGPKYLPPRN